MGAVERTLDEVIGSNVRAGRLAARLTQDELAERLRAMGLVSWRQSTVARAERGTRALSVGDLLFVSAALGTKPALLLDGGEASVDIEEAQVSGQMLPMYLAGTFEPSFGPSVREGWIAERLTERRSALRKLFARVDVSVDDVVLGRAVESMMRVSVQKAARSLGLSVEQTTALSFRAWGCSIDERRDDIAGERATPAAKAQVTATLLGELREMKEVLRWKSRKAPEEGAQ